jgi:hypothetical protein
VLLFLALHSLFRCLIYNAQLGKIISFGKVLGLKITQKIIISAIANQSCHSKANIVILNLKIEGISQEEFPKTFAKNVNKL